MTVLIVEDDPIQQNALKILLTEYNPAYDLLCASSYAEGLDLLSHSDISLFLLDVELNPCDRADTKDGVELARQIRQHPEYLHTPIIFLTSIPERILEALNQTHCFDYLLKPYDRGMLYHCLDQIHFPGNLPEPHVSFSDTQGIHIRLKGSEVLYLCSCGHQIQVHTNDGVYTTCAMTLDAFTEELGLPFFRCHRKYIINLDHASQYDKTNRFVCVGSESVPVGRSYKSEFEKRYTKK